jgi:hypothetical protein
MRIRVKRSVSVYPQYKQQFLELTLKGIEGARQAVGIEPEAFVDLNETPNRLDVKIFTDFDSLAQYEDLFLHKLLKNDSFLDGPEAAVEMIHDNPRDEMFVRLDVKDYFMNRKGDAGFDVLPEPAKSDKKALYLMERMYATAKGRLREMMQITFRHIEEFAEKTGVVPDFHCTRFTAGRIGGAQETTPIDGSLNWEEHYAAHDRMLDEKYPGLLLRPTVTTMYRRVTEDMLNGRPEVDAVEARLLELAR